MDASLTGPLAAARATELRLRRRLADLAARRAAGEVDAVRLEGRSALPGADPAVAEAAAAHRVEAARLAADIDAVRLQLRVAEGVVARLEAGLD